MKSEYLLFIIIGLVLVFTGGLATAAPTTGAATLVGTNNATLHMTSIGGVTSWFEWGQNTDLLTWKTPNFTSATGANAIVVKGSPLNGNSVFYFRACDDTGCGAQLSFTTPVITPMPTTTLGNIFQNLTESQFDLAFIPINAVASYGWVLPGSLVSVMWALVFSTIFLGLWLSGRNTFIPGLLGLMVGGFLWVNTIGVLNMPISPEFIELGQGLIMPAIAGTIVGIFKR
jgi:hypothetical protein